MFRALLTSRCGSNVFFGGFALALIFTTSSYGQAQHKNATVQPGFEIPAKALNHPLATEIRTIITSDQPPDNGAEGKFTEFFEQTLYPTFTLDRELTNFLKNRLQVKQRFFNPVKNERALSILNAVTLKTMSEYANDNYHMIVRYNAMLFISEVLNSNLPGKPTKPYAEALPVLVKAAGDVRLPSTIRDAALIGVKRHAEAGLSDDRKKSVADAMVAIIKDATPVVGASTDGLNWQKMRAAEVAIILGVNTPEVQAMIPATVAVTAPAVLAAPAGTPVGTPATPTTTTKPNEAKSPFDN